MSNKFKFIVAIVSLAFVFALGRYTVPEKVRIETKTVEVEKKQVKEKKEIDKNQHKKKVTKIITKPDGTRTEVTTEVDDASTHASKQTDKKDTISKKSEATKEVQRASDHLTISALVGNKLIPFSATSPTPVYGGQISKDLLGPVNFGVFGFNNGLYGFSLGLSF